MFRSIENFLQLAKSKSSLKSHIYNGNNHITMRCKNHFYFENVY
eukprot:UN08173